MVGSSRKRLHNGNTEKYVYRMYSWRRKVMMHAHSRMLLGLHSSSLQFCKQVWSGLTCWKHQVLRNLMFLGTNNLQPFHTICTRIVLLGLNARLKNDVRLSELSKIWGR